MQNTRSQSLSKAVYMSSYYGYCCKIYSLGENCKIVDCSCVMIVAARWEFRRHSLELIKDAKIEILLLLGVLTGWI